MTAQLAAPRCILCLQQAGEEAVLAHGQPGDYVRLLARVSERSSAL